MVCRRALLIFPAFCGMLHAQSLVVSPAAAAPARDDSIYALRVDPAQYQGQDEVLLLKEGSVRIEADGRTAWSERKVAQILTKKGVENWGEITFWYISGRQRMDIHRIRVIGPDGKVLHDGPAHQQDVSPEAESGTAEFSDRRGIQVTLAGVAPGTLVDYSYTLETLQPALPGDYLFYWYANLDVPIRRSRFTLDAPDNLNPHVRVLNIGGTTSDSVVAGRRVRHWNLADVPAIAWQSWSATPNSIVASIRVGSTVSWQSVGAWFDSLAHDRYTLTPAIVQAHAKELKGAKTIDDSLRATYRWVAQDFRYVSLALGDGRYQPRLPADVFESRFGDCKDKATLFVSLARHMGVTSYPVLVRADGWIDSLQPSIKQFDHEIAAVEYRGKTRYFDVTAELTPYGDIPSDLQGEAGLALRAAGPRIVVLPAAPTDSNLHDEEIAGSFGRDGRFVGQITYSATGTEQDRLRREVAEFPEQSEQERDQSLRKHATSVYATATVDSEHYTNGRDLAMPVQLTLWFTAPHVIGQMGTKYYFNLPIPKYYDAENLTRLDGEGPRVFSIDVTRVNSPSIYRTALAVELPDGWTAELPPDVSVKGPFGFYRARYSQAGRLLRISREMGGLRGVLPPDSISALRTWLRAVAADHAGMIVLSRGTGADLVASGTDSTVAGAGDLPDVLLSTTDLTDAKVEQEGGAGGTTEDFMNFSPSKPLEVYHRSFDAQQMVFGAGASQLASLQLSAAAYHAPGEAQWMINIFDIFDIPTFLAAYMKQLGMQQVTMGPTHDLPLAGVGDRSKGWVFEMVTPVATFDMAIALFARGRVGTTLIAVGAKGMQDSDVVALLRKMDDRVRHHEAYLTAVADTGATEDFSVVDSALAAATSVPLNTLAATPHDSTGRTTRTAAFSMINGAPTYTMRLQGKSFEFPFGRSRAVEVGITITQNPTEAVALKQVVAAERSNRTQFVNNVLEAFGGLGNIAEAMAGGDSTTFETVSTPRFGARSHTVRAQLRNVLRADLDEVVLARGKLSATVEVLHLRGSSDVAAAETLAVTVVQRMRALEPRTSEAAPPASLVAQVTRVVDAEKIVDSLVDKRDIDAAFRVVDGAQLDRAPVGFTASTWNGLCWYGSLKGQAQRAMHACEAAVAPDTTNLSYRDSRGLGRAMAGDLEGARVDFAYVVANAPEGEFHDLRSQWLSKLRAGQNPFTPDVVAGLLKQ